MTGSCYPRWGNLLKGRRVHANSTCGENGPEEVGIVRKGRGKDEERARKGKERMKKGKDG